MNTTWQEVVLQDRLAQEVVALLRAIAPETLLGGHLVGGLVDGLDDGGSQRLCHVADTQTNHVGLRVGGLEGIHLFGDICKQVIVRQFQEMVVY